MTTLSSLLTAPINVLWAAIVSAIISALVSYWFKRGENRHKAQVEYEYEQRKKQRELIGSYHGRLLSASNSLMQRQWNLYKHHDQGWLDMNGNYNECGYYFASTLYRFLSVFGLVRQLETAAVLLDARIAEKKDFIFLNYVAVLHWVMTDVALFDGMPYDNTNQTDHFFSDEFRHYGEKILVEGRLLSFEEFKTGPCANGELISVLRFFDGVRPGEERLRWDRLVALHLILMAFVNTFGYARQRSSTRHFADAAAQIRNPKVIENLVEWLARHELGGDREARKIAAAVRAARL